MSETPSIGAKEFIDLIAFVSKALVAGVHRIDNENHFDGSLPGIEGLKGGDGLWNLVVQESEVLLLKTAHGRPGLWSDNYIEEDLAGAALSWRAVLLSQNRHGD
jgi:hypothetical protein